MKKRVTGIGGIFFKTKDPEKTKAWYGKHLGIETDQYGGLFKWRDLDDKEKICTSVWSPFNENTDYFGPSDKEYMFNYRVENLEELLATLKDEGVTIVGEMEVYDYGKFGWIMDPEGRKIELWEPIDTPFT